MKTLPLEEQLCFSVYTASNAITRLYRPLLQPFGLTYPQYIVMLALWQQDNISLGELGTKTAFDSGTLTPLVKKLEQKNWLQRTPSDKDERVKIVKLTDEGRSQEHQIAGVMQRFRCQLSLSEQELIQLRTLNQQIHQEIRRLEDKI